MYRPLEHEDLEPYKETLKEFEEKGVISDKMLRELSERVFNQQNGNVIHLLLVAREIYRELAIRSGYFD